MDIDDEDELRQELYEAKHKLELLHEDIEKQKDEHERELLSIETKITQKLEEDHDDDQRHHSLEKEKLQNTIVDITLQKDNLQKNLQDSQSRHDAESRNHSEAMKNVKNKIMEYQTWVKTAQEKEAELKSDKKAAKSKCKELIQQTSLLKEEMDSLKKERNGLKEQLSTYENETVNKFDCMEGLEAQIKTLQETNAELESQNATLEMDNADLVDTISSQSEEIEGLKNENMEVTNNLTQSEQVVVDKMKEIDGLRDELTKQKQAMEEEFQQKNSVYVQQNNEEELKKYENRIGLLTQQKDELETQLYDNQTIHQEKINELESLLQQKDNELTQSIAEVQSTTQELTTLQEQSADVISKWKERAETLEVSVTNCQNEIKEKRKEAEDVISQWETHCSSLREQLEEQRQEGEEEWMNELCKKQGTIQELEGSLAGKEESLNQAEEEISILMKELQDMKNSSAEVVEQWKERSDQLEAIITEMESTLEEQRQDAEHTLREQEASATHAISEWEKQCTSLKQQIVELEENLEDAEETIVALEEEWKNHAHEKAKLEATAATSARVEELENEIGELKQKYEKASLALDDTQSQKDELMQTIMKQKEEMTTIHQNNVETEQVLKMEKSERTRLESLLSQEKEAKLEVEKLLVEKQNAYLSLEEHAKERDQGISEDILTYQKKAQDALQQMNEMQTMIGQLQGEIQRLQDARLESHSDQASQSALEMTADSLHLQLESLALDFASVQEALTKEREANLLAQEEINRLELDISYLLQRSDNSQGDDDMRKISMQAVDAKSRKERQEIVSLRARLEQAMDELSHSKALEREIESKYTSLRHEASSYEQELKSTKTELESVNTSLEEMRQHLSNHRTMYQYRLDQLEEERVSAIEKHRHEVEMLERDLSQARANIDRLQYALKQSEKANAALVVTTVLTKEQQEDDVNNDVTRLKLEKEHLLLASSEAAAQTEHRIREVYMAKMTSTNTELELERELRRKAEEALEENQAQLKELNTVDKISPSTTQPSSLHDDNSAKQKQNELSLQIQNLQEEKESLIQKIATMEEASNTMETKYVQAESQNRDMNKELHFEASLSMELARLRNSNSLSLGGDAHNPAELVSNDYQNNTSALSLTAQNENQEEKYHIDNDMYHVVSEMRRALLEERSMYRILMSEHEDVLELVAHYDVTQTSLKTALMHLGGEKAVADALSNEHNVM